MSKQSGVFHVQIAATTVKTVVIQDGREVWELAIVKSPLGFHFASCSFMDSVEPDDKHAMVSAATVSTKQEAIGWLNEQVASYRKMVANARAHRLAHKAANPAYTGPYDGYVF